MNQFFFIFFSHDACHALWLHFSTLSEFDRENVIEVLSEVRCGVYGAIDVARHVCYSLLYGARLRVDRLHAISMQRVSTIRRRTCHTIDALM